MRPLNNRRRPNGRRRVASFSSAERVNKTVFSESIGCMAAYLPFLMMKEEKGKYKVCLIVFKRLETGKN